MTKFNLISPNQTKPDQIDFDYFQAMGLFKKGSVFEHWWVPLMAIAAAALHSCRDCPPSPWLSGTYREICEKVMGIRDGYQLIII